jgi:hypothetical protein
MFGHCGFFFPLAYRSVALVAFFIGTLCWSPITWPWKAMAASERSCSGGVSVTTTVISYMILFFYI